MKKIMNLPENIVEEMCKGLCLCHPEIKFIEDHKILIKRDLNKNKVTLISGGGSGHEPAHGGFIGKGMLDGAICGDVFASPSQIQVYEGIKASASSKGTLLIIKNYSGDVMNFQNAGHMAREEGIEVDYVKVDDDVAVKDSLYTVGNRGVAGTVLVHKIAGAAAERGYELSKVKEMAQKAINHVKSIGFAFSSCTVPSSGVPTFTLEDDEIEFGVGIHGEPGIKKEKMMSAKGLAEKSLDLILESLDSKAEVAVLINGFGGTPLQELYLLNLEVVSQLEAKNIQIYTCFVGNYMTSLEMQGASISLMALDDDLRDLLSDTCDTPGLKINNRIVPLIKEKYDKIIGEKVLSQRVINPSNTIKEEVLTLENIVFMVDKMADIAIENEVEFCALDAHAGDGDFGMSLAKGFKALKKDMPKILSQEKLSISEFLKACSIIIMTKCGGASGPIWGSAFKGASQASQGKATLNLKDFSEMMAKAVTSIQATGERSFGRGAEVGDKTLIDALVPAVETLKENQDSSFIEVLIKSSEAAEEGALKTAHFTAKMGRAGTVGDRSIGHPDAGALGLSLIFKGIASAMK